MTSVEVRQRLTDALRLDLIGPGEVLGPENRVLGQADEILPQRPSTWYLAGFLVPIDAEPEQKADEQSTEEVDELSDSTLRLLTLDQLSRAATLICALELERQDDVEKLGKWPFEIGLWVGKAATPNVMGEKGDGNNDSARARTIAFKNDDRKPSPIPLETARGAVKSSRPRRFSFYPIPTRRATCALPA